MRNQRQKSGQIRAHQQSLKDVCFELDQKQNCTTTTNVYLLVSEVGFFSMKAVNLVGVQQLLTVLFYQAYFHV